MKNTLFFDSNLTPVLLENEENTLNTIWLQITTSAAGNQRLQIKYRGYTHTENIASGQTTTIELEGQYWVPGAETEIRFLNDQTTGDWYKILFPDFLSEDAALQEVEDNDHAYQMQGEKDEVAEITTKTIVYKSAMDYAVRNMTQIVKMVYSSAINGINALFNMTINCTVSGVTDTAEITIRIRVNREFDVVFVPIQSVKNGKYILTIAYPVEDIGTTNANELAVFMEISSGSALIPQGNVVAMLTAAGIADSNGFTGYIDLVEVAEKFDIEEMTEIAGTDSVSVTTQIPIGPSISESASEFGIDEMTDEESFAESIRFTELSIICDRVLEDEETERALEDESGGGDPDTRTTEEEQA